MNAGITTSVIVVSLVYLERVKPYISIFGGEWAMERTFLGSVIVAAKVRSPFFQHPAPY
jgi:hypothetical protein